MGWALAHSRPDQRQQQANRTGAEWPPSALKRHKSRLQHPRSHSWQPFAERRSALPPDLRPTSLPRSRVFGLAPSGPVTASPAMSDNNGQRETRGCLDGGRPRHAAVGGVNQTKRALIAATVTCKHSFTTLTICTSAAMQSTVFCHYFISF